MAAVGAANEVRVSEERYETEQEQQRHQQRKPMMAMRNQGCAQYQLKNEHEAGNIERYAQRKESETEHIHLEAVDGDKLGDSGDDKHNSDKYLQHTCRNTQSLHSINR